MYSGRTAYEDNVIISSHHWNGTQEAVIDCNEGVIKCFKCNVSFSMLIDRIKIRQRVKRLNLNRVNPTCWPFNKFIGACSILMT